MNHRVIIEGDYDGITLSSLASMLCGVGVFPFGIGGGVGAGHYLDDSEEVVATVV